MKKYSKITTATALSAISLLGVLAPSTAAATADSEHPIPPVLAYIRECESGGDYRAVGPSGAGGAYQFLESSWAIYGDPTWRYAEQAPRDVQDAAAIKLYKEQGTNPWAMSKNCWEPKLKAKEPIIDPDARVKTEELLQKIQDYFLEVKVALGITSTQEANRIEVHSTSPGVR